MKIAIVGTGYVGLVTGVCFSCYRMERISHPQLGSDKRSYED